MNREKAVRYGFLDTLRGNLNYDGNDIKIYDAATTNELPDEETYVLLTGQTANNAADYNRFRWNCVQTIEIVSKQRSSVSKDICDDIGEQIEALVIYPNSQPGSGGLTAQDGWELKDTLLETVSYTEFELSDKYYEITKILQISCIATRL